MGRFKNYLIGEAGPNQRLVNLDDSYDTINAQLGLTPAPDDTTVSGASVAELKRNGLAVLLRTTRVVAEGPPRVTKSKLVVCATTSISTAVNGLRGKRFSPGNPAVPGEILKVGFPRTRNRT